MWKSEKIDQSAKDLASDFVGLESDSGQIDSGFLSDRNILTSSQLVSWGEKSVVEYNEDIGDSAEVKNNTEDQMRVDSGMVDVRFCETLSQLSLKPVNLNCLKGKVQSEPTVELTPIIDDRRLESQPKPQLRIVPESPKIERALNLWRLHYSQDEDGDTQLHIAIVQGFHEVALSLIRMAPHPSLFDCLNTKRQSPLHLAVLTHQPSIVRHLFLAGADPGLRNSDGNTALHLASASGDLACAKALTDPILATETRFLNPGRQPLGNPQDLEQRNYEGETCLHSAVVAGNTEIVRLLINVGADLEAKERLGGRTALHLAIECRRRGVTSLLLNECHPHLDAMTYAGLTPYEIASCWDSQIAKELIKLGATPGMNNDYVEGSDDVTKIPQLWNVGLRV